MPYFSEAINESATEPQFLQAEHLSNSLSSVLRRALIALETGDFHTRWEAAKQIAACGVEAIQSSSPLEVIEPLLSLLQENDLQEDDSDAELSWYIARILGTFNHPLAVQGLTQLLHSESLDVAGMAATALANCGAAAIPPLTDLLHRSERRLLAIRALAQIHHPDVVPPLLQLTFDPLPVVRSTAIDALSHFSDPAIAHVFLTALRDPESGVRRSAVNALGVQAHLFDQRDLVDALKPLLWDINLEVCCQTALTLGRISIPEAVSLLGKVLQSPAVPVPLQQAVVRAIGWIGTPRAIDCLQQTLFHSATLVDESQLEIITVLGRLKGTESSQTAIRVLLNALNSQHPILQTSKGKQTIAHSLGQLVESSENISSANQTVNENLLDQVISALIDLLEDSDTGVQLHVIAALNAFDDDAVDSKLISRMQNKTTSANLCQGISMALTERRRSIG